MTPGSSTYEAVTCTEFDEEEGTRLGSSDGKRNPFNLDYMFPRRPLNGRNGGFWAAFDVALLAEPARATALAACFNETADRAASALLGGCGSSGSNGSAALWSKVPCAQFMKAVQMEAFAAEEAAAAAAAAAAAEAGSARGATLLPAEQIIANSLRALCHSSMSNNSNNDSFGTGTPFLAASLSRWLAQQDDNGYVLVVRDQQYEGMAEKLAALQVHKSTKVAAAACWVPELTLFTKNLASKQICRRPPAAGKGAGAAALPLMKASEWQRHYDEARDAARAAAHAVAGDPAAAAAAAAMAVGMTLKALSPSPPPPLASPAPLPENETAVHDAVTRVFTTKWKKGCKGGASSLKNVVLERINELHRTDAVSASGAFVPFTLVGLLTAGALLVYILRRTPQLSAR